MASESEICERFLRIVKEHEVFRNHSSKANEDESKRKRSFYPLTPQILKIPSYLSRRKKLKVKAILHKVNIELKLWMHLLRYIIITQPKTQKILVFFSSLTFALALFMRVVEEFLLSYSKQRTL